jgi:putative transposase
LIDSTHPNISIRRQCELLGVSRASVYYESTVSTKPEFSDKTLMDLIDLQYSQTPFYGSRKIALALSLQLGSKINRKRIQRLMRIMGLVAIYPKPNTSNPRQDHKIYPYLLTGLAINRPGMVWASDITYVKLRQGFAYLVAIIDWYSRKVLSWKLSNTMDTSFCTEALQEAISAYGAPEYFNTDQGAQFTAEEFTAILKANAIKISMDGKGRAIDNVFTERLWRSIKYENIYLKGYQTMREAEAGIAEYIEFYNTSRFHESLDYRTPDQVHEGAYKAKEIIVGKKDLKAAA